MECNDYILCNHLELQWLVFQPIPMHLLDKEQYKLHNHSIIFHSRRRWIGNLGPYCKCWGRMFIESSLRFLLRWIKLL